MGRWTKTYPKDTVEPWAWTGSVEILNKYMAGAGKPVCYAQCWVYSGLVTTCKTLSCLRLAHVNDGYVQESCMHAAVQTMYKSHACMHASVQTMFKSQHACRSPHHVQESCMHAAVQTMLKSGECMLQSKPRHYLIFINKY